MIGQFKLMPGDFCWVYVTINKFSKSIEYKLLVQATVKNTTELLDDIIHRFSLPNRIIIDLGLCLPAVTSSISVMSDASQSSMSQSHTLGLMARSNALMAWFWTH